MIVSRWPSGRERWLWIGSAWLGLGIFDALQTVVIMHAEGMQHAWPKLFVTCVLKWLPWLAVTPLVIGAGRRFPPTDRRVYPTWCVHVSFCIAIAAVVGGWTAALETILNPYADAMPTPLFAAWRSEFVNGIISAFVLYAIVVAVSFAAESRSRIEAQKIEQMQLNEQLTRAQLEALRRQIEPHFLFNSLNAVVGLVRSGRSDDAVHMLAELSAFLRRTLDDVGRIEVTLADEMEFARSYLYLQQMRFADRLTVRFDIPVDLDRAQVPSLILQPLIENAVKHGIARRAQGGTISIAARGESDRLTVCIGNDGPTLLAEWQSAAGGIGLANVRNRLETRYGDAFTLDLRDRLDGGVEASLSLPLVIAAT